MVPLLKTADSKEVYLRREALPLMGNGVISLGLKTVRKIRIRFIFLFEFQLKNPADFCMIN